MPAIKKIAYTETFNALNKSSYANGEHNDCSVKALALVANVPYEDAKRTLAARGRKDRAGAYTSTILSAVRDCGKSPVRVDPASIIAHYPSPHSNVLKSITTHHPRRFNKVWPRGKFLLFTRGHVSAVIDGVLHDWAVNTAKRAYEIYQVI